MAGIQYAQSGIAISWSTGFVFTMLLSAPLIGFPLGGLLNKILVWPEEMVWPEQLQSAGMLTALHGIRTTNWGMRSVLWWVVAGTFVWEWIPLAIFKPLAWFSWPCWASGLENYNVNLVFNGLMGMGLNMVSLDWFTIQAALGSPLIVP